MATVDNTEIEEILNQDEELTEAQKEEIKKYFYELFFGIIMKEEEK